MSGAQIKVSLGALMGFAFCIICVWQKSSPIIRYIGIAGLIYLSGK